MTVRPIFAWYDCRVGFYHDRAGRRLYIFPIPWRGAQGLWTAPPGLEAMVRGAVPIEDRP